MCKLQHTLFKKVLTKCTILFVFFLTIILTSCVSEKKEIPTVYGIPSPIKSLSWGMSVDDCKQKLTDHTLEPINSDSSLMYNLSPSISIFDYKDEIAQIILKFDPSSTTSVYPYQSEALSSIQIIFAGIDIDQMKKKITDFVGTEGDSWIDIKKNTFVTWNSTDTIKDLDHSSHELLDNFWTALDKQANSNLTVKKDESEVINKVVMQYTEDNNCSVEFYGGINVILFNLKQVENK